MYELDFCYFEIILFNYLILFGRLLGHFCHITILVSYNIVNILVKLSFYLIILINFFPNLSL